MIKINHNTNNNYIIKFFIFLFFITANQVFAVEKSKGFLWKVSSKTTTIYLLGSIHAADSSLYPLSDAIENGFKDSEYLVVEVDINNVDPMIVAERAVYIDGTTLEQSVSAETYKMFEDYFKKYEITKAYYNRFKPWFAVMTILGLEMQKGGFQKDYGIDSYFLNKNKEEKKEIFELESVYEQLDLFESMVGMEDAFVKFSFEDIDTSKSKIDSMLLVWKAGNEVLLEKTINDTKNSTKEFEPIMKKMFDDRNIKMTEKIKTYLSTNKKYFVIVGAGHLVGKNGIISLLKKAKKYKITRE